MPFGLKNAGMTFQRMMDQIFADIPYVFIYLDDVLVASRNMEEHQHHLRQVLTLLQVNGLRLNAKKCMWAVAVVEFLGHRVAAAGVSPLPERMQVIKAFPRPATVKDLQAFLGLFTFYRRFVAKAAAIVKPLTDALKGGKKGSTPLEWTTDMSTATVRFTENYWRWSKESATSDSCWKAAGSLSTPTTNPWWVLFTVSQSRGAPDSSDSSHLSASTHPLPHPRGPGRAATRGGRRFFVHSHCRRQDYQVG
jgi:Reverse transcriptase (RNA-dependent DNA polymerase)